VYLYGARQFFRSTLTSPVFAGPPQFWMHTFNVVGAHWLRSGDADAVTATATTVTAAIPAAATNKRVRVLMCVAIDVAGLPVGSILSTS
jgi:hypothetical protein